MKIRALWIQFLFTFCLLFPIGICDAEIVIHGSSTAYTETGGDWQTMGTNDIDGSGGLGTDGYFFFGIFDGQNTSGTNGGTHSYADVAATPSFDVPSYITAHGAGANFTAIADEFTGYGMIDDPNFTDGTNTLGGFALGTGGGAGTSRELHTFTISGLASNTTVRIGVLGGIEANTNGRWDSTSFTLTDGTDSETVGDHTTSPLAANPGGVNAGWIFFDVDADGTYAISATKRLATQGAGLAGVTFDSVTSIPEPSSLALLVLGLVGLTYRRRR